MWLQDIWIPKEILQKIESKVLVLFGDRDPYIPLNHSIEIYNDLPNGELCILPNTYHDIFNHSKLTNDILITFLSKN
jgi:pimeloyl-ACP methyl ester carboxylesterase